MKITLKNTLPATIYSLANCIPAPPILGMNILALFSKKTYTNKMSLLCVAIYLAISLPFLAIHIKNGVDTETYIKSFAGSIFILFTSVSGAFIIASKPNLGFQIRLASSFIFIAFIISSLALLATGSEKFAGGWYEQYYTSGTTIIRYGGYMYEASHLCLIITPLFFYLLSNLSIKKTNKYYLLMLLPPLIATYSIGFFATLIITIIIASVARIKSRKTIRRLSITTLLLMIFFTAAYTSSDRIKTRVDNISSFTDSSAKGRSSDSYLLATQIAAQKSLIFGAGIGQIKIIGNPIIMDYYKYSEDLVETVRIPSSAAEMLASYGVAGLTIKILVLITLYFKLKVHRNTYSNYLYIFFFIYQFYGSFMLSTIEIFCFALAIFIARTDSKSSNIINTPHRNILLANQL